MEKLEGNENPKGYWRLFAAAIFFCIALYLASLAYTLYDGVLIPTDQTDVWRSKAGIIFFVFCSFYCMIDQIKKFFKNEKNKDKENKT